MTTMRRWLTAAMLAVCCALTAVPTAGAAAAEPPPAPSSPANDAFARPIVLSAAEPILSGETDGATFEAGEPGALGYYGTGSLWFTYTATATRTVVLGTCGSSSYPELEVHTGATLTALTPVPADSRQSCAGGSQWAFAARAGTVYRIQMHVWDYGAGGTYVLALDPPVPNDHAEQATLARDGSASFGSTAGATADVGEPDHAGAPAEHSVWFSTDGQAGARLTVAACESAFDTRLGAYAGGYGALQELGGNDDSATCGAGAKTSLLRVTPPASGRVLIALDGKAGATGDYVLRTLHNDDRRGATAFNGYAFGDNRYATHETGEPAHAGVAGGGSVWYRVPTTLGQRVRLSTCPYSIFGGIDTVLAAYTEAANGTLTPLASNDDDLACSGGGSTLSFSAPSSGSVLVAVDAKGAGGQFALSQTYGPSNDDRLAAQVIPPGVLSWSGSNVSASKEVGEPDHAGDAGGASVWYSWQPPAGRRSLTVCGASGTWEMAPVLGLYTVSGSTLQPVTAAAAGDDRCARIAFTATGTTTYYLAVDGKGGAQGTFTIAAPPSNDDFANAQLYDGTSSFSSSGSTVGATAEVGEPAHDGTAAQRSVWYRFNATTASPRALAFQACGQVSSGTRVFAVYRGAALGSLERVASASGSGIDCARVRWTRAAQVDETYWLAVDSGAGIPHGFTLSSATIPANDDFAAAEYTSVGSSNSGSTPLATREAGEPDHAGAGGTGSLWYTFTPFRTETVQLDTCASYGAARFDSVVAVYTGTSLDALTEVAHGDDTTGCGDGRQSRITFGVTAGTTYRIAVDGHGAGARGDFLLRLRSRPGNDDRANAFAITSTAYWGSLDLAGKEPGEPDHAGNAGGHSIWWSWTPRSTGPATIEACGYYVPAVDTLLAVYTEGAGGALTPVVSDDDAATCAKGSRVTFDATAGTKYLFAVDGKDGQAGDVTIMVPPANDHLAAAQEQLDVDAFDLYADLSRATAESGEPAHGGTAAHRSVWYAWKPARGDHATVDTCGSSGRVAVYTGTTMAALQAVTQATGSACPSGQSGHRVRFQAVAGTTYRIAVDDEGSGMTSARVVARMAPANDRFAAAADLGSTTATNVYGTTLDASVEAGEPDHAGAGGSASVWYRWTAPRSGTLRVDTCGTNSYDSAIAVYSGSAPNALTPVAANDDTPGCGASARVRVHVDAGTTYRIAVSGHGTASGPFTLNLGAGPINDDLAAASLVGATSTQTGTTYDAGDQAGEPDHGGLGGDHSVWYRFDAGTQRNVEVRACATGGSRPGLAVYRAATPITFAGLTATGATSNADPDASTRCRVVTLRRASGTLLVAVDGDGPDRYGAFTLTVAIAPANDDRDLATDLGTGFTTYDANVAATAEDGEPARAGSAPARSVWYRFTPTYAGPMTLETCGATFDTVLGVYETAAAGAEPVPVAAADDGCGTGSAASRLRFTAKAGTTYLIAVDGKGGASGSFTLGFPPPNDLFAAAEVLGLGESARRDGTTARAGDESGEPAHAGQAASRSAWYRWTPSRSGAATISTCLGSSAGTRVAVYRGTAIGALTPVASAGPAAGCASGRGARVRTRVTAGTSYAIAVDGDEPSTFTVLVALAPANDDRADAAVLTTPDTRYGDTTYAQAEDGEPAHAGRAASASVWFAYTPDRDGPVAVKTCGASFDTVLGVYTGTTTLTPVASADDGADSCGTGSRRASLSFTGTKNTKYLIALDGRDGATGAYEIAIGSPDNDDFEDAAPLTGAHASGESTMRAATRQADEPAGASSGRGSLWWTWTAPATGTAEVNACGSRSGRWLKVYKGSTRSSLTLVAAYASDARCTTRVTFAAQAGEAYRIQAAGEPNDTGRVRVQVNPPSNDAFTGATALTGLDARADGTIAGASAEPGEPSHGAEAAERSVWYAWTAPRDGRLTVDTCGSATPAVAAIYTGGAVGALHRVEASGNQATCAAATPGVSTTVPAAAGTTYRIAVDGSGAAAGDVGLRVRLAVDETPPATTFSDGPAARVNGRSLTFAFDADEPATFACRVDAEAFAPCASPVTRSDLEEGAHAFEVRATDLAGNVEDPPARRAFTIDRTPPAFTIDQRPAALGRATTVAARFSSPEAGATFECSRDAAAFTACTSPLTLGDLDDGTYRVAIRAVDDVGNVSAEQELVFEIDTTPPTASIGGAPVGATAETAARLTLSADEDGVTYRCRLDEAAATACTSPVDLTGLAEGDHTFRVTATDRAGNEQPAATSVTWTVDTTPPGTTASAAPAGAVRTMPSFTLGSSESPEAFECQADNDGAWAACGSPYTPPLLADGQHTFAFRAVDRAGNADPTPERRTVTLDTTPPTVTIDSGPTGPVAASAIDFTFHASEVVQGYECAADDGVFQACASPLTINNPPEGEHELRIRATDALGNVGTPVVWAFVVDRTPPETTFTSRPADPTNETMPSLAFASERGATFVCSVDGSAFAACASPLALAGLGEGDHTVRVRARDAAGNDEPAPAQVVFEIDRTPPDTSITTFPDGPVHDWAEFGFASTEDGGFECAIDDEAWTRCDHGARFPLPGRSAGEHRFRVRAVDAALNADPTPAERAITIVNEAPTAALRLSADGGPAAFSVDLTIGASDPDRDLLHYRLDFGDGETETGTLPVEEPIPHVYERAGTYAVRLEVTDGFDTAVATHTITVVLPEPLRASAGDDLVAVAGEPVILDATGSRPLVGIERYEWDFGDGQAGAGDQVTHVYDRPGTYTARLTARAGAQAETDTATVEVVAPSEDVVTATVTSAGMPVPRADVLVVLPDGQRVAAVTGTDGRARLQGLPDGERRVLAYAPGYRPSSATATVSGGRGAVTVDLQAGDVARAEMDSRRLTRDEILDLGIDPNDPANQHVFEFTVNLPVLPGQPPITLTGNARGGGGGGGGGFIGGGGSGGGLSCRRTTCKATINDTTVYLTYAEPYPNVPTVTALVIPFRAKWLKEFFEVGMTVHNLADPEFVLADGQATLDLPAGLSLAPTARGERLTASFGDIPGGEDGRATWIVRGDKEGSYDLSANYGATLQPFNRGVTLQGRTEDPLKVWGGSALRLIVDVDRQVRDRYPFHVRVGLKNVADVPVYNPSVELLREGRFGYIEQPVQQREFAADEIVPGDTFWAGPFIIVPEVSGEVDLANAFIKKTAGDVNLSSQITAHDRVPSFADTPEITGHRRPDGQIALQWQDAPGATAAALHSTPDRQHDFDDTPRQTTPKTAPPGWTKVMVKDPSLPWFGVSSKIAGRATLVHPIIDSASLPMGGLKASAPTSAECGAKQVELSFEDEDYALTSWEYRLGEGDWKPGGALSTNPPAQPSATATLTLPAGTSAVTYTVRVRNSEGEVKESEGQRSACVSEWPKTEIKTDGMSCGSGSGTVEIVTHAKEGGPAVTEISYIVGARASQTVTGSSVRLDFGETASYRLRTGGEVIRAAAKDADGNVGTVAVQGVCPEYATADPPAKGASTPPLPARTEGGAPPRPQGANRCKQMGDLKEDAAGLNAAINAGGIPVRLSATCVFRWGAEKSTWVLAEGAVRVSGIDFEPDAPKTAPGLSQFPGLTHAIVVRAGGDGVDPKFMTLGTYRLQLGEQTLTKVKHWEVTGRKFRKELNEVSGTDFEGLKPGAGFKGAIDFSKDSATLTAGFMADQLGERFNNVQLSLSATAGWADGLHLDSVRLDAKGQVAGVIDLDGTLKLGKRDGKPLFGGIVKATFGSAAKKLSGISTDLSFSIYDGKLERASASAAKDLVPPRPLGTPLVLLKRLALDLSYEGQGANRSLMFGGRAGFTAGGFNIKGVGALALVDGEMGLLYSLNENSADAIRLEGQAKLLRGKFGDAADAWMGEVSGESTLRFSGFLDVQGTMTLQPSFLKDTLLDSIKMSGTLFGWLDTTGGSTLFSVAANGKLSVPGHSISGKATFTTKGAGVCGELKVAFFHEDLGATVRWDDLAHPTFGCGFEEVQVSPSAAELFQTAATPRTARAAQAPATGAPMTTAIPADTDAVGYIFTGRDRMPDVQIDGPGLSFRTGAPPSDPRVLVFPSPAGNQVMVLIARPSAGAYAFTPDTAVTQVARSFGLPRPAIGVKVRKLAGGRQRLTYAIRDLHGRSLRFMERGSAGAHAIGVAKGARGSFTYRPREGRAGTRAIYAIYGRGDEVRKVGRYRYDGPARPGRPGRVTVRRAKGSAVVKVGRATGPVLAYKITVRVDHRRFEAVVDPRKRTLTVPLVSKGQKVQVRVVALNSIRKPGPARVTAVKVS